MHKQFKRLLSAFLCVSMLSAMLLPQSTYAQENVVLPKAAPEVDVWVQNSADRAFESSEKPKYASDKIGLFSAKNEYEAVQILVRSKKQIDQLTLTASVLTNAGGETIPASSIEIFSEYSAPADVAGDIEPTPDGSNRYTDALFPQKPLNVAANKTQPYWVRIYTPSTQNAGIYTGTVTVSSTDGTIATIPLSLKVYDVTIPKTNEATFKMNNWFSSAGVDFGLFESAVPSQYDVKVYDENWWKVMENFAKDLAIHRNNVEFIDFQALLIPGAVIDAQGNYTFDWTLFDRFVNIFIDAGALQYIYSPGGYLEYGNGKMTLWSIGVENDKNTRVKIPLYTDEAKRVINPKAEEYIKTLFTALRAHMQEKYPTYIDKFYISAQDEPSKQVQHDAANWFYKETRKYYPELLSNEAHSRFIDDITESTTLCPVLHLYEQKQQYYKDEQKKGRELWYYTCIDPQGEYLNRFIPYHLAKTRLIPWYAYQINATGYLHWGYSWWRNLNTFDSKQTGDEWLVRPDKANYDVFTSVRHEAQLDGLEDYELLGILKKKFPDTAKSIADNIIQTATDYTKSGTSLNNAHKIILDAIEANNGTSESVPLAVFSEDFSSNYDTAWKRTAGRWTIENGEYKNIGDECESVLKNFELTNGEVTFDVRFDATNTNGLAGIDVRKTGGGVWNDGLKVMIHPTGYAQFFGDNATADKGYFVMPSDGICTFTLKMQGDTITLYKAGVEKALLSKSGCSTAGKGIGISSMYGTSYIDNIKISSYEGPKTILDTKIIDDQSYSDKFNDATLANWEKVGGTSSVSEGKLILTGNTNIGLKNRVFSDMTATFTLDLSGTKTAATDEGFWGGIVFGSDRYDGSMWDAGNYTIMVCSNGKVYLTSSAGSITSGTTTADLKKPITVKVIKDGGTVKAYINDEKTPIVSANGLNIPTGFINLNSDGGTVSFDDLSVTGLIKEENYELIDDFSGDLSKWTKTTFPENSEIKNGVLHLNGVGAVAPKGISPDLVLTDKPFTNVTLSVDIKIDRVALEEDFAGIFFNSSGQDGFWKSGGYLLYITNKSNILIYKYGASTLQTAKMSVDPTEDFVNVTLSVIDSTMKVYVNHSTKPVLEVTDRDFKSGYFGLMSDFCDARFDNVKYTVPDILVDDFSSTNKKWVSNNDTATVVSNGTLKINGINGETAVTPAPRTVLDKKIISNGVATFDMKINKTLDETSWAGCTVRTKTAEGFDASDGYQISCFNGGKVTLSSKQGVLAQANTGIDFSKSFVNVRVTLEGDMIKVYLNNNPTPVIEKQDSTLVEGYLFLTSNKANAEFDNVKGQGIKSEDTAIDHPVVDQPFSDNFDVANPSIWKNPNTSAGTFTVENSKLNLLGTSTEQAAIAAIKGYTYTNSIIEFDMEMDTGMAWSGVALRRSKWDDTIWADGYFIYYVNDGSLKIFDTKAKANVVVTNIGKRNGASIHFKVVTYNNKIRVYIDNATEPTLSYTDAANSFTSGYVNLCSCTAAASYDNLTIIPYDGSQEPTEPEKPKDKLDVAFSDNFDKEALADNWEYLQKANATWTLADGKINATSVNQDYSQLSLKDHVYTDATISFDMTQTYDKKTAWSYVAFRRTDKSDGIWKSGYFMFYNANEGWLKIYKTTVDGFHQVDIGKAEGKSRHFDIVMKANNFKIYVDGAKTPAIDYTDEEKTYTKGYIALGVIDSSQASYDNLVITPDVIKTETFTTTFMVDDVSTEVITDVGAAIVLPADPQKIGFSFKGWYTSAIGGTKVSQFNTAQTVYAQFEKETTPPPVQPDQPDSTPSYNQPVEEYIPVDRIVEIENSLGIKILIAKEITNLNSPMLEIQEFSQGHSEFDELKLAAKGYDVIKSFRINLYDFVTPVHKLEGGKMSVTLPFSGVKGTEYLVLQHNADGTVTILPTTYTNQVLTFESDVSSNYSIVTKAKSVEKPPISEVPQTGDTAPIYMPITLLLLAGALLTLKKIYKA